MAEPTLSLTFEDLGRSTAFDLGWGRKATASEGLTSAQDANVEAANRAGYRDFLAAHEWAFLRPRVAFTLWATKTGTCTASGTTVTATAAKFFPSMIGHEILIESILNGTFAADTDWTKPAGVTIASGKATAVAATGDLSQTVAPLTVGITYRVAFTVTRTAGSIQALCGTAAGTSRSTSRTFTEDIVAAASTGFKFTLTGFSGTIDNVTVEAVYTISAYTSATVVTVSTTVGAATAKAFTVAADGSYRLPDDFGSMFSTEINFAAGTNDGRIIKMTSEGLVVAAWQSNANTYRPTMAGIRPLVIGTGGQRNDLVVYYIPDVDYVVSFRYEVNANALTAGQYPYGGLKYAETIRKMCLGAAEGMFNEHQNDKRTAAQLALRLAIAEDIRANRSDRIGKTRPRQQYRDRWPEPEDLIDAETATTVHGVSYD
jgi:hypothetical protein